MLPEPGKIVKRVQENETTVTLATLLNSDSVDVQAGQFYMLQVFGIGEAAISVSNDPAQDKTTSFTIQAKGSVTNHLVNLKKGDTLWHHGPYGKPWPISKAYGKNVLLIAGGIGLAPIRALIYQLLLHRDKFNHIHLVYGARHPSALIYKKELKSLQKKMDISLTVDFAEVDWPYHVGSIPMVFPLNIGSFKDTIVYMCGPELMMHFVANDLITRGIALQNIYISVERNMQCGTKLCGHCQWGPYFVCADGPIFNLHKVQSIFYQGEI